MLKFFLLNSQERRLFVEAWILLLLSTSCVWIAPFKRIVYFLGSRWKHQAASKYATETKLIEASLSRAAKALPWKSLCLSVSIAQFIMLRRRGIPAVIVAGVRVTEESKLVAHAWVDVDCCGENNDSHTLQFTPLFRIGA
jgi:hypothetical protein